MCVPLQHVYCPLEIYFVSTSQQLCLAWVLAVSFPPDSCCISIVFVCTSVYVQVFIVPNKLCVVGLAPSHAWLQPPHALQPPLPASQPLPIQSTPDQPTQITQPIASTQTAQLLGKRPREAVEPSAHETSASKLRMFFVTLSF